MTVASHTISEIKMNRSLLLFLIIDFNKSQQKIYILYYMFEAL